MSDGKGKGRGATSTTWCTRCATLTMPGPRRTQPSSLRSPSYPATNRPSRGGVNSRHSGSQRAGKGRGGRSAAVGNGDRTKRRVGTVRYTRFRPGAGASGEVQTGHLRERVRGALNTSWPLGANGATGLAIGMLNGQYPDGTALPAPPVVHRCVCGKCVAVVIVCG